LHTCYRTPGQPLILRTVRGQGWRLALPDSGAEPAQSNLRPPRDAFIGRDDELASIGEARLCSVVGPPGVGKSRFALEYAVRSAGSGRFREVWISEIDGADSEADIAGAIARTLGVVLRRDGDWVTRVGRSIAGRGQFCWSSTVRMRSSGPSDGSSTRGWTPRRCAVSW